MKLSITDKTHDNKPRLVVSFDSDQLTRCYEVEGFKSPVSASFRQSLNTYFYDFQLAPEEHPACSSIAERAIQAGRELGEELLGEDHELLHIKEIIEQNGYQQLTVVIAADDHASSDVPWELMVLPDSDFVLSSVARSFTRVPANRKRKEPLLLGLGVDSAVDQNISSMLAGQSQPAADQQQVADKPLCMLCHAADVGRHKDQPVVASDLMNLFFKITAQGEHFVVAVDSSNSIEQLKATLENRRHPLHVFYYEGPVRSAGAQTELLLGDRWTDATLIAELLGRHGVSLWYLSLSPVTNGDLSVSQQMHRISELGLRHGVDHMLALSQATLPQVAHHIFNTLINKLAAGHEVAQAVVESRKALQMAQDYDSGALKPVPLYVGPMLIHYGERPVVFFAKPSVPDSGSMSRLKPLNERLFGFSNAQLPPLLYNTSDGQSLALIKSLQSGIQQQQGSLSVIMGEAGIGKSHMTHLACAYLALTHQIDYAFCFNAGDDSLDPEHIAGMVNEVVQIDGLEHGISAIASHTCCFVFDQGEAHQQGLSRQWNELLETMVQNGQAVILVGGLTDGLSVDVNLQLAVQPMGRHDRNLLASHVLRQQAEVPDALPAALLERLGGNPWLIKKSLPLAGPGADVKSLISGLNTQVLSGDQPVQTRFFAWQWQYLPEVWKNLLLLCKDTPGLLLEMIMMICDQKQPSAAAEQLLAKLGEAGASVAEGLTLIEQAGFIDRFPHGRTVAGDALSFLHARPESCEQADLLFSQVVCEGVRSLAEAILKQPNSSLSNNLIINRRHWARHLEKLWFAGEYEGFFTTVAALFQLLKQVGLEQDLVNWKSDVLARTQPFTDVDTEDGQMAWLVLATGALNEGQSPAGVDFKSVANSQTEWFLAHEHELNQQVLPFFQQSVLFLDAYHRCCEHWSQRIQVLKKAEVVYQKHQAWHRLIWTWRAMAHSWHELGDVDQVTACEHKIIEDVPYEGSPDGFKTRQYVDVIIQRVARGDFARAQSLLDQVSQDQDSQQMQGVLAGIQCDIHMGLGQYMEALPHYRQLWISAAQYQQADVTGQLLEKLRLIMSAIGEEAFVEHFEAQLPGDIPRPSRQLFQ